MNLKVNYFAKEAAHIARDYKDIRAL